MTYVHINRPSSQRYVARVRRSGCRRFKVISRNHKSYPAAVRSMVKAFMSDNYKRGQVIVVADYYDPVVVCELVNR